MSDRCGRCYLHRGASAATSVAKSVALCGASVASPVCQPVPYSGALYGPLGAAGQVTDDESAKNPGNVSPLDDPVPDALEQADTRRSQGLHHRAQKGAKGALTRVRRARQTKDLSWNKEMACEV
jgi:hypothetical protein